MVNFPCEFSTEDQAMKLEVREIHERVLFVPPKTRVAQKKKTFLVISGIDLAKWALCGKTRFIALLQKKQSCLEVRRCAHFLSWASQMRKTVMDWDFEDGFNFTRIFLNDVLAGADISTILSYLQPLRNFRIRRDFWQHAAWHENSNS